MKDPIIESYGSDVFSEKAIRRFLPRPVAAKLIATMRKSTPLDPTIADAVAEGMKNWALEKGATHFTHWFQPLTGGTAEKHDAFPPRRSLPADLGPPSRPAATPPGTRPRRPSSSATRTAPRCASPRRSAPSPARRWT